MRRAEPHSAIFLGAIAPLAPLFCRSSDGIPLPPLPTTEQKFTFQEIEEGEVKHILTHLKANKAMGIDGISSGVLRMAAPAIAGCLASLFNWSLRMFSQENGNWPMSHRDTGRATKLVFPTTDPAQSYQLSLKFLRK